MLRLLLFVLITLTFATNALGQVYHYETGKVITVNDSNQIIWQQGTYNNYPADYGTLIVKENRNKKNSRLINIPVIRIKAANPDSLNKPVFLLNGGPGESNFQPQLFFEELLNKHDIVLVGYRGVDGSVKLNCPCMKNAFISDTINLDNSARLFQIAADSCLKQWKQDRIDVNGYSMDEVVGDIEITRKSLEYNQINLLSFSYGTMLSQLYYEKYPKNIAKMILIGARPINYFLFDGDNYNKQIYKLYKHFKKPKQVIDSNLFNIFLSDIDSLLNAIIDKNKNINPYRFLFFGFSKLYSIDKIEKVFEAYEYAFNGNPKKIIKLYNEFYRNFPGDIITGDVLLKKQGRVAFKPNSLNTIGDRITNAVNVWYSPQIPLLENSPAEQCQNTDTVGVLFIMGGFDVASPPDFIKESNYLGYKNYKTITIQDAGHLDLLVKYRSELYDFIKHFLE